MRPSKAKDEFSVIGVVYLIEPKPKAKGEIRDTYTGTLNETEQSEGRI
ncbi:MAG: hypothetical protein K5929_00245 [Lachnospiraceae bacterium]|nr:hypothetical protein [Lachnospiraceae bacterium]